MQAKKLGWLGVRTDRFEETVAMFRDTLGVSLELEEPGRAMFILPSGDPIDVFDESLEQYANFTTGPVVGFVVDDVEGGRSELEAKGIEVVGPVHRGNGFCWAHFRGPDGNLYELQGVDPDA